MRYISYLSDCCFNKTPKKEENKQEQSDPANGHEYIEIGGIKWATMNVGANSETDYGLYFQWGDTQGYTAEQVGNGDGKKAFTWTDYKYSNNGGSTAADMTKYNSTDGKTVLDIEDDVVRVNWGGTWRMPTVDELRALSNAVNAVWTTNYNGSGINGLLYTDINNSSKTLFFPAAGNCGDGLFVGRGSTGRYWSSSLYSPNAKSSRYLLFHSGGKFNDAISRYCGHSVRGVLDN